MRRARGLRLVPVPSHPPLRSGLLLTVVLLIAALGGLSMGAIAAARSTESSFADSSPPHTSRSSSSSTACSTRPRARTRLQPDAAADACRICPTSRRSRAKSAQHGSGHVGEQPGTPLLHLGGGQRRRAGLQRGPVLVVGPDGQSAQGRRVRHGLASARRSGTTWARSSDGRRPPTPRFVGQHLRQFRRSRPSERVEHQAGRHRWRAGDHAVPGPGLGHAQIDHAVHAGVHQQAPRVLQQRHAQRAHARVRQPVTSRSRAGSQARAPRGVALHLRPGATIMATAEPRSPGVRSRWASSEGSPVRPRSSSAGRSSGRRIRLKSDELDVLRALGADPTMTLSDGLIGTLVPCSSGCAAAVLVALGLSPLAPLGPVGPPGRRTSTPTGRCSGWVPVALLVTLGARRRGGVAPVAVPMRAETGRPESRPRVTDAPPRGLACRRPPSPGSASPSSPASAAARCRCAPPSSARCSQ